MNRARGKGKVSWVRDTVERSRNVSAHPYVAEVRLPDELVSKYMVALVPGGLFVTTVPLSAASERFIGNHKQHTHKYLWNDPYPWGDLTARYPVGTVAIYVGQVRVEETSRNGRDVMRLARHSFIVGGVQYITACLQDFDPVSVQSDS